MKKSDIIKLLSKPYSRTREKYNFFNKLSVKELCLIMDFIKKNFRTEKGNWSVNRANKFIAQNYIYSIGTLNRNIIYFYNSYSKRKKTNAGLLRFIEDLKRSENHAFIKRQRKWNRMTGAKDAFVHLKLKDNVDIRDFLKDVKDLKKRYLKGSNDVLLGLISEIETGYSKNTLRNYFYDSD